MKTIIIMMVLSLVYLTTMDVINKKISSINFSDTSLEYQQETENVSQFNVKITGAINNPGSYVVPKGANLAYLVTLAGGVNDNADTSAYNLEAILDNDVTYYISSINSEGKEKVSINTANMALLDTLPGIGTVLAKRIISYRNDKGLFESIEDITKVSGIGQSLFEQIKDLICL